MTRRVGINASGRIGPTGLRAALRDFPGDLEGVAVNDLLEPDDLAPMLRHDSVHRRFRGEIADGGWTGAVHDRRIRLAAIKAPAERERGAAGAQIVVASTGLFQVQA